MELFARWPRRKENAGKCSFVHPKLNADPQPQFLRQFPEIIPVPQMSGCLLLCGNGDAGIQENACVIATASDIRFARNESVCRFQQVRVADPRANGLNKQERQRRQPKTHARPCPDPCSCTLPHGQLRRAPVLYTDVHKKETGPG